MQYYYKYNTLTKNNKRCIIIEFSENWWYNILRYIKGVIILATRATIGNIKRRVEQNIGRDVTLRTHSGRKKYYTKQGNIVATYRNIFVVNIDCGKNSERHVSYTYSDLLTSTVEITLDETNQGLLA